MPQIKHIAFNSFQGTSTFFNLMSNELELLDCFAVATDSGIRVFNSKPLVELVNIGADVVGSIKLVALLNRTNFIALVSGEPRPKFSNKTGTCFFLFFSLTSIRADRLQL